MYVTLTVKADGARGMRARKLKAHLPEQTGQCLRPTAGEFNKRNIRNLHEGRGCEHVRLSLMIIICRAADHTGFWAIRHREIFRRTPQQGIAAGAGG